MSDEHEMPVCIYDTKEAAKAAESKIRAEIADVLRKHGALAAVIAIGMAHREGDGMRMNVGIEGAGSVRHARLMANDICRPGLFS